MNTYHNPATNAYHYPGGSITLDGRRIFNPTPGQLAAAGYQPVTPEEHTPTLDELRARKLAEIDTYDTSEAVNSFTLDGAQVWLDKATRVGLMNSLSCEKAAGRSTTTLWLGTTSLTLGIDLAMQLLAQVELYALECYNVTAAHRAAVAALTTPEAIAAYDHTTGYPEHPEISTKG